MGDPPLPLVCELIHVTRVDTFESPSHHDVHVIAGYANSDPRDARTLRTSDKALAQRCREARGQTPLWITWKHHHSPRKWWDEHLLVRIDTP